MALAPAPGGGGTLELRAALTELSKLPAKQFQVHCLKPALKVLAGY
jgi:hypothetical protein